MAGSIVASSQSALADDAGEQAELADGTADLALEPRLGQPALAHRARDEIVLERGDAIGDGVEEGGAGLGRGRREAFEGGLRQRAGLLDLGGAGGREGRLDLLAGRGVGPPGRSCCRRGPARR